MDYVKELRKSRIRHGEVGWEWQGLRKGMEGWNGVERRED
jgi:hypothetical protein